MSELGIFYPTIPEGGEVEWFEEETTWSELCTPSKINELVQKGMRSGVVLYISIYKEDEINGSAGFQGSIEITGDYVDILCGTGYFYTYDTDFLNAVIHLSENEASVTMKNVCRGVANADISDFNVNISGYIDTSEE